MCIQLPSKIIGFRRILKQFIDAVLKQRRNRQQISQLTISHNVGKQLCKIKQYFLIIQKKIKEMLYPLL